MTATRSPHSTADLATVARLARQLRVDSIRASTSAGSGHPTSSMSAADLMAVLVARHLRYDWEQPKAAGNDHLIFSKGHASPLLYSIYRAVGVVSDEELMSSYRRFGSRLQGHPTPVLPWVDVATGSLGQGLPDGVGVALAGKYLDRLPFRVWVLCGDSEMAEGSMWEALDKASHYQLSNLVAIVDVNRLGQRGPTELGWDLGAYASRAHAFGARVLEVDGHDLAALDDAFTEAAQPDERPTVILARTIKGRGFSEVEDREGWHGKALPEDMAARAIAELGGESNLIVRGPLPLAEYENSHGAGSAPEASPAISPTSYARGDKVATRRAYGDAVTALGARDPRVVALDGEVSNSTYADAFAKAHPDRYFEMFIAEQQMVASAVGLSVRGYKPFASTFAAFLTRAYDFIRMAAISQASVRLVGSHAGVEIGADGPSQMALEDLAMMRAVQGSTVLYPSDAVSAAALVDEMARTDGISYLRTTRGAYPVLYGAEESFRPGGSKILRSGPSDAVTLIGAGVTLHECLRAADQLALDGIHARVIDLYSIKPIDTDMLVAAADATGGRLVVAEDHHPEGGLGSAVVAALVEAGVQQLRLAHLSVSQLPASGTPAELLAAAGIDAPHIASAAAALIGK
ncbi:MAG TPA: transketolase [Solirubrobacteraceae bacterium]|nr:transketolase [Solirubrobacteraceae bacterium]